MKLYIAQATCSLAVQLVANELGLSPELVHFDVLNRTDFERRDVYGCERAQPMSRYSSWTTLHPTV